jgi:hypothetical protein
LKPGYGVKTTRSCFKDDPLCLLPHPGVHLDMP